MNPGMYSVSFNSGQGSFGEGLVFFDQGKVHGGDKSYLYLGHYTVTDGAVTAQLTVRHHHGPRNSIFGANGEFQLSLTGKFTPSTFQAEGSVVGQPQFKIGITGNKVAEPVV
jgi:hypothetical protein